LSGDFTGISTFVCCSGFPGTTTYLSSFSDLLKISGLHSAIATQLGFNPPPNGGAIAQIEIFFGKSPTYLAAFSGTQAGDAITVNDTASVPEPTSLILLGTCIMGFAIVGRKLRKPLL